MRELCGDWRDVFKGFRMALDPRKITLAVGGIAMSAVFVFAALWLVLVISDLMIKKSFAQFQVSTALLEMTGALKSYCEAEPRLVPLLLGIVAVVGWCVWAYFGGAICRIAAVEIAKDERIELVEAAKFAREKYRSLFWSPLAVVLAIIFFGLCNAVVGVLLRGVAGVRIACFHGHPNGAPDPANTSTTTFRHPATGPANSFQHPAAQRLSSTRRRTQRSPASRQLLTHLSRHGRAWVTFDVAMAADGSTEKRQ